MEVTIRESRPFPILEVGKPPREGRLVVFELDSGQMGSVILPVVNPTDTQVKAAIAEEVRKNLGMIGRKFSL